MQGSYGVVSTLSRMEAEQGHAGKLCVYVHEWTFNKHTVAREGFLEPIDV